MMSGDVSSTDTSTRQPQEHIGNLVAIRPGRTLVFNVDSPIKRMSRTITIRNICGFPITYKIKTTSREGYRVKPHTGLLEPGQSADTVITLLPHNQFRVPQDKFLVMAARAGNKLKAKDRRKLDSFWKKFSKEKFGTDYMEHQLSCALNVDEYMANEDDSKSATDSEIDRRFKDESVMGDDYITPVSSVLLRQTPGQKTSYEDEEPLERSSADYMQSVAPSQSSASLEDIRPSMAASAQESVTPEAEYSVAASSQARLSDEISKADNSEAVALEDEVSKSNTSDAFPKKEAVSCDNTPKDTCGRERSFKRTFKSIMKKKRRSSSKGSGDGSYQEESYFSNRKSGKKAQVAEPKMFTKIRTCPDNDNHDSVSADDVVISLQRTEDVLNKHITCFKGFQVFVVVAICALCIIIIILMVNFPSAISIHKTTTTNA